MKRVALVGTPNVGKTALFNALTGSFQKVANFPGVTVEKKIARMSAHVELVDLPGLYSLDVATLDEKVTRDFLTGKTSGEADAFVVVLDATNLPKSLYLLLQLTELGHRPLVALTQMDQSDRRGQKLDLEAFAKELGCDVVPVSAASGKGMAELKSAIASLPAMPPVRLPENHQRAIKEHDYVLGKFRAVDDMLARSVKAPLKPDTLTAKLDRWALHPVWGFAVLALVLLTMFQALFTWAAPLQDGIEAGVAILANAANSSVPGTLLRSLVADGIISGVGSVVVFLPQILLLFLFIQILEDAGYLGRAVFLMDGFMRKLGLPGKAMVPFLSSHACAIPGVMATRIMEDKRERLVTMLVLPLTTCSARLPVYTLLIAALLPPAEVVGPFTWQGLALFGLYGFAVASALLVAFVLRKALPKEAPSMLLMELPPYRLPRLRHLWKGMLSKARIFLGKAGRVILALSLVIWALVSFPRSDSGEFARVESSYAAQIGRAFEPVFAPLGFDWRINTALIPAIGAREVMVASLGTVFAVEGEEGLTETLAARYTPATLLALILWFVFAPQCISTFAVMRRESGGWAVPLGMVAYTFVLAWLAAFAAFRILS